MTTYHQLIPEGSMEQEPAFTAATVSALVTAVIALAVAFGVPITDGQRAAILTLVALAAPFLVAWYARRHTVTKTANAEQVAVALATPSPAQILAEPAGDAPNPQDGR